MIRVKGRVVKRLDRDHNTEFILVLTPSGVEFSLSNSGLLLPVELKLGRLPENYEEIDVTVFDNP